MLSGRLPPRTIGIFPDAEYFGVGAVVAWPGPRKTGAAFAAPVSNQSYRSLLLGVNHRGAHRGRIRDRYVDNRVTFILRLIIGSATIVVGV